MRLRDHAPAVSLEPPLRDSAPSLNSVLGSPSKVRPSSVIATKNTRKRMEDRHVVLHDLKAYLPSALQTKVRPLHKMIMLIAMQSLYSITFKLSCLLLNFLSSSSSVLSFLAG